jgi:hypothetical protein
VFPWDFRGTEGASTVDLWAPISMQQILRPRGLSLDRRGWGWLRTIGRGSPGIGRAEIEGTLARVAADISRRFPSQAGAFALVTTPASVLEQSDRDTLAPVVGLTFAFTGLLLIVGYVIGRTWATPARMLGLP